MESKVETRAPGGAIGERALAVALLVPALMAIGCTRTDPPSAKDGATTATARAPAAQAAKVSAAPEQLQVGFGRREAPGTKLKGWHRRTVDGRDVARVAADKSSIGFELSPLPRDYLLAAVARSEGAKPTTLTPTLNGQSLPAWSLTNTWGIYVSPVPAPALSAGRAELVLTPGGSPPDNEVSFDSLALVPVSDRATLEMSGTGQGLLIDGFYAREERTLRWSRGNTSALAVVLRPGQGAYRLSASGAAFPPLAPLAVKATLNGKELGSVTFLGEASDVSWDIPAGALSDGLNRIELAYARTGKPSAYGESKDSRDIAVRFSRVTVEPL